MFWRFKRERPASPVYVGSYEDKLTRIPRLHIDPDDDGRTREDKLRERAYEDADRRPLSQAVARRDRPKRAS